MGIVDSLKDLTAKSVAEPSKNVKYAKGIKDQRSRPVALFIAEVFLLFVVSIYFAKICILAMSLNSGYDFKLYSKILLVFEVVMMFIALDALIGISSKKPKSWRKVVRSSSILLILTIATYGRATNAAAFLTFNPLLIIAIVIPIILLMFTKSVRAYYTPLMEEIRPPRAWMKFVFFTPVYDAEEFRIRYRE